MQVCNKPGTTKYTQNGYVSPELKLKYKLLLGMQIQPTRMKPLINVT